MEYPADFISRVQDALPEDGELVELMAAGSIFSVENRLRQAGQNSLVAEWQKIFASRPKLSILEGIFSF